MEDHGVEGIAGQRAGLERLGVELGARRIPQAVMPAGVLDPLAGDGDHVGAGLDRVHLVAQGEQDLRHPAGAAAHLEDPATGGDGHGAQQVHDPVHLVEEGGMAGADVEGLAEEPGAALVGEAGDVLPRPPQVGLHALGLAAQVPAVTRRPAGGGNRSPRDDSA
jgi:hypothetical protein